MERGNGTISRNGVAGRGERAEGGGRTERDEPPFINLDRLLNPGFDETRAGSVHTRMSLRDGYAYTHARTPVLVSR